MKPVIELKNLTYVYGMGGPFQKNAIRNINIKINQGELLGIIGHTGSGKSTLVQHLNGLLKPTSGQVILNGVDIWEKPKEIRSVRFKVGMVFQYPEHQLFEDTVRKDIAFGPTNMGLSKEEIEQRVMFGAKLAGLKEELLDKSPFDLSGGEKRRCAIAGVIAMDPDVLVLDEPTAGLDPKGRDDLLNQIQKYHDERKNTVVIVSHSMEDIAKISDRVLVMNKSEVAMLDTTQNVFARGEELINMGLSVPQITKVFMELSKMGYDVDSSIYTLQDGMDCITKLFERLKGGNND